MAATPEDVGLLFVHGIGEQKPLDHLRCTAAEIASYAATTPNLTAMNVIDRSADEGLIIIDVSFGDSGGERRVRLNCREVWWADLGISGGLGEQLAFWFWGLGQWAAEVRFRGRVSSNTTKLMDMPAFPGDTPGKAPARQHRLLTRALLFGAGVLALLTLLTWELAKRLIALLSQRIPDSSLIFLFLGDVKIYQDPGGPGRGTVLDPDMPPRATIRRKMISALVDMAVQPYDRWYVLAHSLGSVIAFNGLQETELALPNYLTQAQWQSLPARLKTRRPYKPPDVKPPSTKRMMPRRPPFLDDKDGIRRKRLFDGFAGFVTYGAPLDKFAALWPRIVCLNKQKRVFRRGCEWVNLYDPTDPVGAPLDAFGTRGRKPAGALEPGNFGCRSSIAFLLSHIRYFSPRSRRQKPIAGPVIDTIIRGESLSAAARPLANSRRRDGLRLAAAILEVILLFAALTIAAGALIVLAAAGLTDAYPGCSTDWLSGACRREISVTSVAVFFGVMLAVLIAGMLRMNLFDRWYRNK